jgi:hypothetical protein
MPPIYWTSYTSNDVLDGSDHAPVGASFEIDLRTPRARELACPPGAPCAAPSGRFPLPVASYGPYLTPGPLDPEVAKHLLDAPPSSPTAARPSRRPTGTVLSNSMLQPTLPLAAAGAAPRQKFVALRPETILEAFSDSEDEEEEGDGEVGGGGGGGGESAGKKAAREEGEEEEKVMSAPIALADFLNPVEDGNVDADKAAAATAAVGRLQDALLALVAMPLHASSAEDTTAADGGMVALSAEWDSDAFEDPFVYAARKGGWLIDAADADAEGKRDGEEKEAEEEGRSAGEGVALETDGREDKEEDLADDSRELEGQGVDRDDDNLLQAAKKAEDLRLAATPVVQEAPGDREDREDGEEEEEEVEDEVGKKGGPVARSKEGGEGVGSSSSIVSGGGAGSMTTISTDQPTTPSPPSPPAAASSAAATVVSYWSDSYKQAKSAWESRLRGKRP